MTIGLPVSRLINVDVILTPLAAQAPNLNTCLIVGSSNVIDVSERIRSYGSIEEVAVDFGTVVPEYLAAALFFGQVPQPDQLYIGRWAEVATSGILYGGVLSAVEQTIATWNAIVAGQFKININGTGATNVVCGSFAAAANLNAVAAIIQVAVRAVGGGGFVLATVTWNGSKFVFTSGTTGAASTVAYLTAGNAADISAVLKGTLALGASTVAGIAAEEPVAAVATLDNQKQYWYMMTFADTSLTNLQYTNVAAYIQAANNKHIFGVTNVDPNALDINNATDISSLLKAGGYSRTVSQYSLNSYAIASFLGRAVTVNFEGNNTVITMMYKPEPSVVPESLTTAQADAIQSKNCNVFVTYNNDTSIIQYGKMASGAFFDEIQDLDWLANQIQTNVFNLLYTSPTKIPQTDAGNHLIMNSIEQACAQAVANGTLAPGQWNSNGFGQLKQGDYLNKGYYIYAPPIYLQSQASREARESVPFQVAAKLAGAIHTVDVIVNVNR